MLPVFGIVTAVANPDPYALFARARARWAAQQYPHYLSYTVRISGVEGDRTVTNTYASFTDTQTGAIRVHATSAEEAAQPYVPRGVNFNATLKISYSRHTQLSQPSADGDVHAAKTMNVTQREQYDLLGVPMLSPTYSFGLTPAGTAEKTQTAAPPSLKTIASLTAVHRDYNVRFDGIEPIDGVACYRLKLTPRGSPAVYRLREVWIEPSAGTTRQALLQGNFTEGPAPALPWLVHFALLDGAMYIRSESALQPVSYLGRTYTNVTVSFERVQTIESPGLWSLSLFRTSGDVLEEPPSAVRR
jgi:hypothetical protein